MTNESHLALDDKPGLDLETNFGRLVRRAPTATEKERLHHIKSSLGIRDADAIWSILMALQFYDSLYSQYPKAIGAEASRIFGDVKAAAEASLKASIATARADLAKAVGSVARDVARDIARRESIRWAVAGMALGVMLLATGAGVGIYVDRQLAAPVIGAAAQRK
jgi:hypothetical protein